MGRTHIILWPLAAGLVLFDSLPGPAPRAQVKPAPQVRPGQPAGPVPPGWKDTRSGSAKGDAWYLVAGGKKRLIIVDPPRPPGDWDCQPEPPPSKPYDDASLPAFRIPVNPVLWLKLSPEKKKQFKPDKRFLRCLPAPSIFPLPDGGALMQAGGSAGTPLSEWQRELVQKMIPVQEWE
jgi:hypothetical protein